MTASLPWPHHIDAPPRPVCECRVAVIVEQEFLCLGCSNCFFNLKLNHVLADHSTIVSGKHKTGERWQRWFRDGVEFEFLAAQRAPSPSMAKLV